MNYRKLKVAATFLIVAGSLAQAQTYSESRKTDRSFPASSETRLELSNKYGTVHVIPWQKDSVHIEIDLYIQSNSPSRLAKISRNVDFEFSGTRYYILAGTRFGNRYNTFFSDLKDLSNSIIPSRNRVEINYTVHVPGAMNISITNKYGDIYIDDMKGSVSINLSNGDLKANSLTGDSRISLNFGNGIINELANATLTVSFADIEIPLAKQLTIESKSSKLRLGDIGILKTNSRRDKYTVSRTDNFFGESWFSEIWLYRMDGEINFSPRYGVLKADTIPAGFSLINVNTDCADLNMTFDKQASFILEVTRHEDVVMRMPDSYGELEIIDQEADGARLRGMVGRDNTTSSRVKITAPKKCIISLQSR